MAKRGPKPKKKENTMPPKETEQAPSPEETVREAPVEETPVSAPEPRKHYNSFYEAWPNILELRKLTQRHGVPRLGLSNEDMAKANALIDEYRNG